MRGKQTQRKKCDSAKVGRDFGRDRVIGTDAKPDPRSCHRALKAQILETHEAVYPVLCNFRMQ